MYKFLYFFIRALQLHEATLLFGKEETQHEVIPKEWFMIRDLVRVEREATDVHPSITLVASQNRTMISGPSVLVLKVGENCINNPGLDSSGR